MAHSDAIATFPQQQHNMVPNVINTQQLDENENILKTIVQNLDEEDDIWKLRILLCSVLEQDVALAVENGADLLSMAKDAASALSKDFSSLVVELLYTIKRYDLVKLTGNCKHRLKDHFDNATQLEPQWKRYYEDAENMVDTPVNEILSKLMPQVYEDKSANEPGYDFYQFKHSPCGYCIIINNENFTTERLKPRTGSTTDANALQDTFRSFDFEVETRENLKGDEMKDLFKSLQNKNYDQYDCLVCCILSHGDKGIVYGTDEKELWIENDIIHSFAIDKCRTLTAKPKLFFIQACQGNEGIGGEQLERDGPPSLPNISDYLVAVATIPGYSAFRSPSKGSWFIKSLTEELRRMGDTCSLADILTSVNRKVAEEATYDKKQQALPGHNQADKKLIKQTTIYSSTLRKKIQFRRKRQPVEA